MGRALCNATVEPLPDKGFRVLVTGRQDHSGIERVYDMPEVDTQDDAAMEGIRRFVEEFDG